MGDHGHYHDVLNDLSAQHRALRQETPEVYTGFNELSNAAVADGAFTEFAAESPATKCST